VESLRLTTGLYLDVARDLLSGWPAGGSAQL